MTESDVVESRRVYTGRVLGLRVDSVRMSDGAVAEREVVDHPGSVVIVALDEAQQVVLVNQYRHPVGRRLDELPADGLKVDKKFIQRLTTDARTRTVVRSVVDVGKAYGLVVTAEGIEDAATLQAVRDLGIDYAQGYYLSRPQPAPDLVDLLASTWRH